MNSRERVRAAIEGATVDRVPTSAWGHTYREEWSPEELAGTTVARAREYGWDFVKFQPRATFFSEAFGNRYHPSGHRLRGPILEHAAVPDLEAWKQLELVAPGAFDDQVRALGIAVRELGDEVPVIQTVFSPISVADYLIGRDKRRVVRELRRHPDVVVPALGVVLESLIEFARKSVEAGAAGVFYAVSGFATPLTMPAGVYDELVLPLDRRFVEALPRAAWFNVLHLCGSRVNLDVGRRLPVQAVSYSMHNKGNPGLAEARRLTGKAVMGGLEQRGVLVFGPRARIAAQVREAVESTGGLGLLLAPGCSVPPRAPASNLAAMMEAVAA